MKLLRYPCLVRLMIIGLSLVLGWVSHVTVDPLNLCNDYIWTSAATMLPILLTLLVLSATLGMNLLREIQSSFTNDDSVKKYNATIDAIKGSFFEGVITFLIAYALLISRFDFLEMISVTRRSIFYFIFDSVFVYCVLLFLWIISDAASALFDLYKKRIND